MNDPFTFPISCPKLVPRSVGIAILIYFLSLRALCNKPAFYGRRILGRKPGLFPGSFLYDAHAARIYIVETCLRQPCIGPLCFNCLQRNPCTIVRAERDIFALTRQYASEEMRNGDYCFAASTLLSLCGEMARETIIFETLNVCEM